MTGDFGEVFRRVEDEHVVVVGAFKFHRFGFDFALALAQSLAGGTERLFRFGGRRRLLELTIGGFDLVEVESGIRIYISSFD